MKDVVMITRNEDGIGANIITYICDYNDIEIFIRNSGCATPLLLWYVGSQTGTWKLPLTSHILVSCYSF